MLEEGLSRPAFFVFAWRQGLKAKHVYPTPLLHSQPSIIVSILKTAHHLKAGLL